MIEEQLASIMNRYEHLVDLMQLVDEFPVSQQSYETHRNCYRCAQDTLELSENLKPEEIGICGAIIQKVEDMYAEDIKFWDGYRR